MEMGAWHCVKFYDGKNEALGCPIFYVSMVGWQNYQKRLRERSLLELSDQDSKEWVG